MIILSQRSTQTHILLIINMSTKPSKLDGEIRAQEFTNQTTVYLPILSLQSLSLENCYQKKKEFLLKKLKYHKFIFDQKEVFLRNVGAVNEFITKKNFYMSSNLLVCIDVYIVDGFGLLYIFYQFVQLSYHKCILVFFFSYFKL